LLAHYDDDFFSTAHMSEILDLNSHVGGGG
jgi:hypothetical protein